MRCSSLAATALCASAKPVFSSEGKLSVDQGDEPSFYSDNAVQIGVLTWKMKSDLRTD